MAPAPVQAPEGIGVTILYANPTVTAGALPLVGPICAPASGSTFAVGSTAVSCTVTDAKQRSGACSFAVTVTAPPRLAVTRFVAFGDSITWGEDGANATASARSQHRPTVQFPLPQTYPGALQSKLRTRYPVQMATVVNAGLKDEAVTNARTFDRFRSVLASGLFDVVLLMEGANDLADRDDTIEPAVILGLQRMIDEAKGRGNLPLLATLPPENPNGCCPQRGLAWSLVAGFNDRLRLLAAREGIPLVDVNQAFGGDLTLIGFDGLHPNAGGYDRIAETFLTTITQLLEARANASSTRAPLFVSRRPR